MQKMSAWIEKKNAKKKPPPNMTELHNAYQKYTFIFKIHFLTINSSQQVNKTSNYQILPI